MDDFAVMKAARARVADLKSRLRALVAAPMPDHVVEERVDAILDEAEAALKPSWRAMLAWIQRRDNYSGAQSTISLLGFPPFALMVRFDRQRIRERLLAELAGLTLDAKNALGSDQHYDQELRGKLLDAIQAAEVREEMAYRRLRLGGAFVELRQDISGDIRQASDAILEALAADRPGATDFDSILGAPSDVHAEGTAMESANHA